MESTIKKKSARAAEIGLVGIAAIWGLTFPMVKDAVSSFPVSTFLALRFLSAFLIVAAWSLLSPRGLRKLTGEGWRAGALMGLFLTGGYIFQTLGLDKTSASNAGFITGLFVVLTPLFRSVFLCQQAGRAAWVAALVSAIGLFLLSRTGGTGELGGDALVFLCACSFALHILATDAGVRRFDIGALLAVQLGVCGVISLAFSLATGDLSMPDDSSVWSALAVTALLATALGFFVQTYAQRHADPARTALILASEPAFAGLFAYLMLGETLRALGWFGAALILASIVTVEAFSHLRPPRPLPEG
ncbi:MAG: DMT family transporter [Actinomycetota bacterium]|nr:DMT family transporter [Actinomycetota bacterium]